MKSDIITIFVSLSLFCNLVEIQLGLIN